jgi:hypothetical protein
VFAPVARPCVVTAAGRPLVGSAVRSEPMTRAGITVLVGRTRFAVGPIASTVRVSRRELRQLQLSSRRRSLFGLGLPLEFCPTSTSRTAAAADSSHGLCSLQHIQAIAVHLPRALPARYVPPSGFGYPRDGLLPRKAGPVLFHTGSAPGIRPSELFPPDRCPTRSRAGRTRMPFLIPDDAASRRPGPESSGFRALTLPGIPCRHACD